MEVQEASGIVPIQIESLRTRGANSVSASSSPKAQDEGGGWSKGGGLIA